MIAPALLDRDEKAWLNAYHARVRKTLSPKLDTKSRKWLARATAAIA
jgi:Xaa-Pro aminopeptidase